MSRLSATTVHFVQAADECLGQGIAQESTPTVALAGVVACFVNGESTRPGAKAVSTKDQIARIVPVISRLVSRLQIPISIDIRGVFLCHLLDSL